MFSAEERPKALAVWVAANAISFPIGPIVGGWLLSNFWWGSVFLINVPVVVVGLIAVTVLLPESRSAERPRLDLLGVLTSSLGLAGLTYGVIEAGEKSWLDPGTLAALIGGIFLLLFFLVWQRRTSYALVDLALFRSAGFTCGSLLATLVSFAMFGVLFVVPQYFQGVLATDALGSGLRLLPVIAGLLVGSQLAERIARRLGAKLTAAIGFVLLAAGLIAGATTGVATGYSFAAGWITVIGLGLGFTLPTAMDAALGALTAERSGVGSGLIMALRQVGGTIGVAVLGTVLNSRYRSGLDVTGLPAPVAHTVRGSVSAGVAVAHRLHSALLLDSVRTAFLSGMDAMLGVCGGIALLGIVLTLSFLPRGSAAAAKAGPEAAQPKQGVSAWRGTRDDRAARAEES